MMPLWIAIPLFVFLVGGYQAGTGFYYAVLKPWFGK